MKTNIKKISTVLAVVALITTITINWPGSTTVNAGGATTSTIARTTTSASSTLQFLSSTATASSTLITSIDRAESVSLQMCNTASSSSAYLDFQVFFSMSPFGSLVTPTWFQETDSQVSASLVTHSPLTRTISLATSTVGTNYLCTDHLIAPVGAKQIMIKYGVRAANTGIWMSINPTIGY